MFTVCHYVVDGETVNDCRYHILEIGERIKVSTEHNRVLSGENHVWGIGFHDTAHRQRE